MLDYGNAGTKQRTGKAKNSSNLLFMKQQFESEDKSLRLRVKVSYAVYF